MPTLQKNYTSNDIFDTKWGPDLVSQVLELLLTSDFNIYTGIGTGL